MTSRATATTGMTRAEVLELARTKTTTDVQHLARAAALSQNVVYEAIARGEWTATRVLRVGRLIKIPTADILVMLGLDPAGDPTSAA